MDDSRTTSAEVEQAFDNLRATSERLAQAAEEQFRQIEERTKTIADQADARAKRLLETIGRELRVQLTDLRRDIDQLMKRVGKRAPAKKTAAKKTAAKKATAKKTAAKKATAKKTAAKKTAKKTTAKKTTAKKAG